VNSTLGFSTAWLGSFDSAYLFCYALGNYISGMIGDNFLIRFAVPTGMALAALNYVVMAILCFAEVEAEGAFIVLWGFQGLFQSIVWPGTVSIMANWFSKKRRGSIMGFWCSNASVGDICGTYGSLVLLVIGVQWQFVIVMNLIFILVVAGLFLAFVRDSPSKIPGVTNEEISLLDLYNFKEEEEPDKVRKQGISFWKAWLLPGVLIYALNYACIKLLNYSMMMWLPYYLNKQVNVSDNLVKVITSLFDFGGIIGAFVCGWISDKVKCRTPVISLMLIVALPIYPLFLVGTENTYWLYFILVPIQGFLVSGAAGLISCVVAADLAQNEEIANNKETVSTVTGILDGTGSVGAGIGQLTIGFLAEVSWYLVFAFMMVIGVTGISLLVPTFIKEVKKIRAQKELN